MTEARLKKGFAWCLRQSGWTYREIGAYFGHSVEWSRTMVLIAERRIARKVLGSYQEPLPEMPPC